MTFDELNLNTPLLDALVDLSYVNPTPIQEQVYPVVISGRDVVGIAQTGTGKTMAYLLPILRELPYSEQRQPRVLIIVPTRELVVQVVKEAEKLTTYKTVRIKGVYGGTNINTQKQLVYDGCDILVATPGRLMDLVLCGVLRLKDVKKLVIDEVDEMLNQGFRMQLVSVLENLPSKRQNLMFSATLSEDVEKIIGDYFFDPVKVVVAAHGTPLEQIRQVLYLVPNITTKVSLLEHLFASNPDLNKVLVFVNSRRFADRLSDLISPELREQFGVIHSNKSQPQRLNTLKRFQEGEHRALIATDIIARGLDINAVSHVINFELPEESGDYIHRIGRTGRADHRGIAISFVSNMERGSLEEIENMMKIQVPREDIPEGVAISTELTEDEKQKLYDKNYLKSAPIKLGAFHEKKDKNKKVNLGGPKKRNPPKGSVRKRD